MHFQLAFGFDDLLQALAIEARKVPHAPNPLECRSSKSAGLLYHAIVKIHMVPSIFKSFKQFEDNCMPKSLAIQFK